MVELNGIYKKTGSGPELKNISLHAAEGETVAVVGRKRSGKSLLADIAAGCVFPAQGGVIINGTDMAAHAKRAKRCIGYMPQHASLYPEMTVYEYVSFACSLRAGLRLKKQSVGEALSIAGAEHISNQLLRRVSNGGKKRAALAAALCANPKVLLIDEPTIGLGPEEAADLRSAVSSAGEKRTVILFTQNIREAAQLCGRIIVLHGGEITAQQTTRSLLGAASEQKRTTVRLKADRTKGRALLQSIEGAEYIEALGSSESGTCDFVVESPCDIRAEVFRAAAQQNIVLLGLSCLSVTLEDIFAQLAGGEEGSE